MIYDVIVIGVGAMGSAACSFLAEKCKVLGIDQFDPPHERGSHTGQTRIIRKAYFEHSDYIPLLDKAYTNWQVLEATSGEQLYFKTGILYMGPSGHPILQGVKRSAALHEIKLDVQPASETRDRFPRFTFQPIHETFVEPDAGFLVPEKVIALYRKLAVAKGATIQTNERVINWSYNSGISTVITDKAVYKSKKLVITAGAWAGKMIPQLSTPLVITRQVIAWVVPDKPEDFSMPGFPCWLIADKDRPGALYGFPFLYSKQFGPPEGLKFAWHYPGEQTDPDHVHRDITPKEIFRLIESVSEYIPAISNSRIADAKTCLYANSRDENFIVDFLPGYASNVVIACGFSGHGFKFASVIGEILSELTLEGRSSLPIEFLRLDRFG